jgi:hybrid polyketide synthase/nonribosomal peptide synthetase ACE1
MPPIAGVAHGAMVLRDTMLEDMTIEEMNAVIRPKVIGSINLNDLFSNTQLDFFIFLSSAIGITGNVGQCNYAVANIFMHGLAAKRRKNGLAASVIVIGVILGVGYVIRETSQSLQDNLEKSGHNWMSERDFHILFGEAIRDGPASSPYSSEIVVGLKTIRRGVDQIPPWAGNPRFSHLILQSEDGGTTARTSNEKIPLRSKFLEASSVQEIYEAFRGKFYSTNF